MRATLMIGTACVLGLGVAGCSAAQVSEVTTDGGVTDGATADTVPGYAYVVISDVEFQQPTFSCSTTNAPGTNIDAVALIRKSIAVGYLMKDTATFTVGNAACAPADCSGGDCTYASPTSTTSETELVSRTEGPPDAVVHGPTNGSGYMSLNGGSLQFQIGDVLGNGPPQTILSGDQIKVFEVDQSYKTATNGCICTPAHYQLWVQNAATSLQLNPVQFDPANSNTCGAAPSPGYQLGCGTTAFAVP